MSNTVSKIVWDVFIEESMGEEKAEVYVDRLKDYSEDMCYITYANIIQEVYKGTPLELLRFEDIMPDELKMQQ